MSRNPQKPRARDGAPAFWLFLICLGAAAGAGGLALSRPPASAALWDAPAAPLAIGAGAALAAVVAAHLVRLVLGRKPAEEEARDVRDRA